MKLILTHGLPGSGKSTWAEKLARESNGSIVRVNRDDIRTTVFGEDYHKKAPDKNCEELVTNIHRELMVGAWKKGKAVVCDDTNLNPIFTKNLVKLAREHGASVEQEYFNVPVEVCQERNRKRGEAGGRFVPPEVIESMASKAYTDGDINRFIIADNGNVYNAPRVSRGQKKFDAWAEKRKEFDNGRSIVIVDVDGTLAMNNSDAEKYLPQSGKKDFKSFFKAIRDAKPNKNVVELVNKMSEEDNLNIIVLTGRSDYYADELLHFLDNSGVKASRVIAKNEKDFRPDNEFKKEVLNNLRENGEIVVHAVDDRPRSIAVLRNNDILVSTVDENYNVDTIYGSGACLRCGKPLKNGNIGPVCRLK